MDPNRLSPKTPVGNVFPAPPPPSPISTPQTFSSQPPQTIYTKEMPSPGKPIKILIGVFLILFLVIGATGGAAAAVAYEKVNINNPTIERPLEQFVIALPFMPKTPKFLLESAALAHSKISKHTFDASLAAKSSSFMAVLGSDTIDAQARGGVDYSDPANLKTSFNASITKDFNMDLRKKDDKIYFKINKVPSFVTSLYKVDPDKLAAILANWVVFDTSTMGTPADKALQKSSPQKSITAQYLQNTIEDMLDDPILAKMELSDDTVDGNPSYKLHLDADGKTVDNLVNKIENRLDGNNTSQNNLKLDTPLPSTYIKNFKIDLLIDKQSYLVRQVTTTFTYNPSNLTLPATNVLGISKIAGMPDDLGEPGVLAAESSILGGGLSSIDISTVLKFDNFGKEVDVQVPDKALSPQDYYTQIMNASSLFADAQSQAIDARRMQDIRSIATALEIYYQVNNKYPSSLSQLDQKYINTIPTDPVTKQNYIYTPNAARTGFTLKAKLDNGKFYQLNDKGAVTQS